jgi:hypothetical protein
MSYDADRHHRRSIRLKEYDYAQPGAYFVTSAQETVGNGSRKSRSNEL